MEKRQSLQQPALWKLDSYMWINEAGILPHTTHKISSKCLTDLKHKTPQDSWKREDNTFSDINPGNVFLGQSPKATGTKSKTKQTGLQASVPSFTQQREAYSKPRDKLWAARKYLQRENNKGFIPKYTSSPYSQYHTIDNPILKSGRRPQETVLQRQHQQGQQAHGKTDDIANYQRCKWKRQWVVISHWSESWPSSKGLQIINAGEEVENKQSPYPVAGHVNWRSLNSKEDGGSLKN